MLIFAAYLSIGVSATAADTLYYQISQGDQQDIVEWIITPIGSELLEIRSLNRANGVRQIATCDTSFATLLWQYHDPSTESEVIVQRIGHQLRFSGLINGKNYDKVEDIEELPWLQFPGLALGSFSRQNSKKARFYSIKPENGKLYKLQAKKKSQEMIDYYEKQVPAQRVSVSLTGFFSAFGGVNFWMCSSSGRFLRYQGFSGVISRDAVHYRLIEYRSNKQPAQELTVQTINRSE